MSIGMPGGGGIDVESERPAEPSRVIRSVVVALVLVTAAALRCTGMNWDDGHHLHPDERFLTMLAADLRVPSTLEAYLDTARSPLNPTNVGRSFFTYGTLPLFLTRLAAETVGFTDYGRIHLVGRALSALLDLGSVLLVYLVTRRLAGFRSAVAASLLLSFSVLNIQQAHFFTVDSAGTFFTTLALWALVTSILDGTLHRQLLFGVAVGFAMACRINLGLLVPLYALAIVLMWRLELTTPKRLVATAGLTMIVALATFRLSQPYAFEGPGFFSMALAPEFMQSMSTIAGLAGGASGFPPSVQWVGREPILFAGRNLLLWGIGPVWGLAAAGALVALVAKWPGSARHRGRTAGLVIAAWTVLLFVFHATQFAATLRYFLPIVPMLAVATALWLGGQGWRGRLPAIVLAAVLISTAAWAVAFTSIYRRPPTRVEASRWIYDHVDANSVIATEHWDDALPLAIDGRTAADYQTLELKLYDEETDAKRQELLQALDRTDVIVLSSNRLYRSIPREPWRYPLARRYYELLFSGTLGFELAHVSTSYPRLGPIEIADDTAEEAFTVYDHPKVLVFRKASTYASAETTALLNNVSLAGLVHVSPREASALYRRVRPSDLVTPDDSAVRQAVTMTRMGSIEAAVRWFLALELLSVAIFCLLHAAFRWTLDAGYGLAKILAWLAPGSAVWMCVASGWLPSNAVSARSVAGFVIAVGAWYGWRHRAALGAALRTSALRRQIVAVEVVWLGVVGGFLAVKALSPAIYWGEKPMDFAILNAILRTPSLPPADPWFAGETLNYFYFGHFLTAVWTMLAGVPAAMAFNLALPTLAGLTAVGAFLVVHQLTGRRLPAVVGGVAVVTLGNLAGPRAMLSGPWRINFDYFWATSRVIPGTINEYPLWNLTFADLHSHVLAMPLEVALLYLGALWLGPGRPSRGPMAAIPVAIIAWLVGAVAVTSAWSTPATVVLQLGFLATLWRMRRGGLAEALGLVGLWLVMLAAARLIFWPFWSHYVAPPTTWGPTTEPASVGDVFTVFGVFLLVTVPLLATRLRGARSVVAALLMAVMLAALAAVQSVSCAVFVGLALLGGLVWWREDDPAIRVSAFLVAAAGGLGVVTETIFVWDRMNTVFKLYLEMWMLLGCATAVLAWVALRVLPSLQRAAVGALLSLAVVAGMLTSATAVLGFLREPRMASPVPTLDGLAYLRGASSSELPAFDWFNQHVQGIPVVLEAHGPSYQAFARVSMNTGLPTVVGWRYHLIQQSRPPEELDARIADVQEIYTSTDRARVQQLLRRYRVGFVVVGAVERQTYAREGLAKFDDWPFLRRAFASPGVTVYATPGGTDLVKTWVERVPFARMSPNLKEPRGVGVAPDGSVFVADFGNRRVRHYGAELDLVGEFGSEGAGPSEFRDPCGIAVDSDGTVWVADTWNHRIQHLSPAGDLLAEWRADMYGPRGIAIDRGGALLVADTGNHRVLRFDAEGTASLLVGKDMLDYPVGLALGPEGEIYVADAGHRRIAVFSSNGQLQRSWAVDAWTRAGASEPYLAVGVDGVVWATDGDGGRVLLFTRDGALLGTAMPTEPLRSPRGIALIDASTAVVADAGANRLVRVARR